MGAKTDFGTHLGTFLAPLGLRGEVRGGENAKIEHFRKSSLGSPDGTALALGGLRGAPRHPNGHLGGWMLGGGRG